MPGGLIPCATNSAPATSLFALAGQGGGGGGGAGPNLNVSSINVNPAGQITFVNDASLDSRGLLYNIDAAGTSSINYGISYLQNETATGIGIGLGIVEEDGGGAAPWARLGCGGIMIVKGDYSANTPAAIIEPSTDAGIYVSSFHCSSINGVAPGGSAGPDPTFSTITTQLDATIGGSVTCGGITINGANATTTTLSVNANNYLSVANGVNTGNIAGCAQVVNGPNPVTISSLSVSSINGASPGGAPPAVVTTISSLINLSTINYGSPGVLQIAGGVTISDNLGVGNISTLAITSLVGGSVSIQSLATSTIASLEPIQVLAPLNVSSLNVSSINGAAPGGGSALQFSTLAVPGGAGTQFPVDPGAATAILSFSTTAGHVYNATCYARATTNGVVPSAPGDMLLTEIVDNNTGNDTIGSWLTANISTMASNGAFYQQVGGSLTWKAGGAGASFSVYSNTSSVVFMDGINLVDYGAI